MLSRFNAQLTDYFHLSTDTKILLAVSGGRDSMVMLDLFSKSNYSFSIAHCNFSLRGEASDGDELFVRQEAKEKSIELFVEKFDTKAYMSKNKLSVQMAARELRYKWFQQLSITHSFDYVAIAHHSDDTIETFFLNLMRRTGISGLTGITTMTDTIIRPLYCFSRNDIDAYISKNKVAYREDASNSSTKYSRNKLRHDVIPTLEEITPEFKKQLLGTIEVLNGTAAVYFSKIEEERARCITKSNHQLFINIKQLLQLSPLNTYLFEFLKEYGFNTATVEEIAHSLNSASGKTFYSDTHLLLKDRENLVVTRVNTSIDAAKWISVNNKECVLLSKGISQNYSIKVIERNKGFTIPLNSAVGCFDFDKVSFPLAIKLWNDGDYFYPLGMKKKKKVSDFFIDCKLNRIQKKETNLLFSAGEIIWITGLRPDDRYKVDRQTKRILLITPEQ